MHAGMHDTDQENPPPVDPTPRAQPAMQSTALQAGGEVDDAVQITKVTRTSDPMWTVELSDDDEGDTAAPSAAAELSDNDEGDTAAPPAAAVVKSEPDCMEIDDPLGPESNERHLQHVRASNRNRSRLMYIKMEESAPWEAAAKKRNRLNARLPYVKIEETGHGEKERMSSGAAPGKKRKKPEGPAELAQGARNFNFAQRVELEASFSESNRCPASPDDLVVRLNGLKASDGKTASAENVREWFKGRQRSMASKGPEGPQGARNFNYAQRVVLEASFRESNQCPAGLGDLVDRLNGLKADKGKDASEKNVREWFKDRRIKASEEPEGPQRSRFWNSEQKAALDASFRESKQCPAII